MFDLTYLWFRLTDAVIHIVTANYYVMRKTIRGHIPKGFKGKVLDLGCGDGIFAKYFSCQNYLGIDMHAEAVAFAKRNYPDFSFLVGDITMLNIKGKFDLVLVIGVIHHLNDEDALMVLDGIHSHLNEDARIIVIELIPPIFKWNFICRLVESMDRGKFIRNFEDYKKLFDHKFCVEKSYPQLGGVVDYGIFILAPAAEEVPGSAFSPS